jgi:hypothetical protein
MPGKLHTAIGQQAEVVIRIAVAREQRHRREWSAHAHGRRLFLRGTPSISTSAFDGPAKSSVHLLNSAFVSRITSMKALERLLWAALGGVVGFLACLVMVLIGFIYWRSSQQPAPVAVVSPVVQQPAALRPVPEPMPIRPPPIQLVENGKEFGSLADAVADYEAQGFQKTGQFPRSEWPARVTSVQEATNQITFQLKGGMRHTYSGYSGYRLKVVRMEDAAGKETAVVFRSREKISAN